MCLFEKLCTVAEAECPMNALRHSVVLKLWSLLKTETLSLCTTWKPTDALWLFVVWCSIQTLLFASCVFDVFSLYFDLLGKHYGKAENARKWVWMDDLCVSHTLTLHSFCCNRSRHSARTKLEYLLGQKGGLLIYAWK